MSDNWAMDLARDLEVETTDISPIGISSPCGSSDLEYCEEFEYDYVEQQSTLCLPCGTTTDDGYVSCSSSLSDGDKVKNAISKADVKRLKKNATQKQRELKKNKSLNELRDIIIKYKNIQPKGRRRFTELVTLQHTRDLIKQLMGIQRH